MYVRRRENSSDPGGNPIDLNGVSQQAREAQLDRRATTPYSTAQSQAFAEQAVSTIAQHHLPATPGMFEIWFAYHAGDNPGLNLVLDDLLLRKSRVQTPDLIRVCRRYIHLNDAGERIGVIGAGLDNEVREIADIVDEALDASIGYGTDLSRTTDLLDGIENQAHVRSAVLELATIVDAFRRLNHGLEARLRSSKQQVAELRDNLERIQNETQTDPLTGLLNRRAFDFLLPHLLAKAKHNQEPTCLVLCDVNEFRNFNSKWGHLVGDQVLRLIAGTLTSTFKGQDLVSRFGGEEFAIVLPHTLLASACNVADQLRRQVIAKVIRDRNTGTDMGHVTLSIGIVQAESDDTPESILGRADACLYFAKNSGRNRVVSQKEILTDGDAFRA
jgi:diguanylate cyclase